MLMQELELQRDRAAAKKDKLEDEIAGIALQKEALQVRKNDVVPDDNCARIC